MEDWSPDRPYLKALDAAAPERVDRVLAREEQKNAELPAFYFDVAEWLYRKKRTAEALEMLLSALELTAANEQTVSMVADRLLRFGRVDRAVWLYERRANSLTTCRSRAARSRWRSRRRASTAGPERARADLTRAVELLNEIVTSPGMTVSTASRLVSLMDLNRLLPKLEAAGVSRIPSGVPLQGHRPVRLRLRPVRVVPRGQRAGLSRTGTARVHALGFLC